MKNLVLTLVAAVTLTAAVFAQNPKMKFTKNDYANLTSAVTSENTGLKKSAIYLTGKYEMKEMDQVLINQLSKEEDPSTRILIALALYKIGTDNAVQAVGQLAKTDTNKEVKRMAYAIMEQVEKDRIENTSTEFVNR